MVIPGDGFLNEFAWRQGVTSLHGAVVMDAVGTLFRYARFMASMGTCVSRVGYYAKAGPAMLEQARIAAGTRPMDEGEFSGRG